MFGLPAGVETVFVLIIILSIIVIGIKWIIASFKAFKAIAEIRQEIGYIYNILKEKNN
ncbi:MAG: hypothetical protein V1779_09545 [bacterium]